MNIQKEVEKFEAKKSKLIMDFVQKMTKFVNDKYKVVSQIDKTMESLATKKDRANADAEAARQAIREVD